MRMTRKMRGAIDGLKPTGRATLEQWLFDDCPTLTYRQAQERLQAEFGFHASLNVLSRFYRDRTRERMILRMIGVLPTEGIGVAPKPELPADVFGPLMERIGRAAGRSSVLAAEEEVPLKDLKELALVAAAGAKLRQSTVRMQLQERDVALKEVKFRRVVAVDKRKLEEELVPKEPGGLSDETIEEIERRARLV